MDIKEALENLQKREKLDLISLIRKFKKEGIETYAITKLEIIETVLAELEKKDTEITALQMEHEHDVKMIDEVKGEALKLYNEIEQLKIAGNGMDLLLKQQTDETQQVLSDYQELGKDYHKLELELENKDTIINTMQAEFERLEDLEDNTDILKIELEKKDMIILKMAKFINYVDADELICKKVKCDEYESIEKCEQCIIKFFKKKVEE